MHDNKVMTMDFERPANKMVTINVSMKMYGNLIAIKERIDAFAESDAGKFLVGSPVIHRTTKFTTGCMKDDKDVDYSKHERKVVFKLSVPIEYNGVGHRISPTSILGKYMDDYMSCIQFRNAGKGDNKPITLEPHHLKFAQYKSGIPAPAPVQTPPTTPTKE